jgi:hypothetical protein
MPDRVPASFLGMREDIPPMLLGGGVLYLASEGASFASEGASFVTGRRR